MQAAPPDVRQWGQFGRQTVTTEFVKRFVSDEDGQDVVEYGLLIATIAIVVLVATTAFGSSIQAWFATLAGRITTTGT
jgi:Flp pilus assembly pilin Flp